ncbi:MAG: hypothetical protein V4598_02465 [Bdellovibrionota bacterium]
MLIDTQKVSSWYVLHRGFRLTSECRNCQGELSHYKAFEKNASGILSRCDDCGKELIRMKIKTYFLGSSSRSQEISAEAYE